MGKKRHRLQNRGFGTTGYKIVWVRGFIKKASFSMMDLNTIHRKRGTLIVCCFPILRKMNLNYVMNSSTKMSSTRKSGSRTEAAAVSAGPTTPT